jgi:hypothetical protein
MSKASRRTRLLDKSSAESGVIREVTVHDLDGDAPFEAQVGRQVNRGHASTRDALSHLISAVYEAPDYDVPRRSAHARSLGKVAPPNGQ